MFSCATGVWDIRLNQCVSKVKCAFDRNHGAVLEKANVCIDKIEWLRTQPLNYLSLAFEAKTAESQKDLAFSNSDKLCGVGAIIDGQFCTCPGYGENNYYDLKSDMCVLAPTEYDGQHNIKYDIAILPNGWYLSRHILLNLDDCTEIDGYRTTNYQECVADCKNYVENEDNTTKGRYVNGLDYARR